MLKWKRVQFFDSQYITLCAMFHFRSYIERVYSVPETRTVVLGFSVGVGGAGVGGRVPVTF